MSRIRFRTAVLVGAAAALLVVAAATAAVGIHRSALKNGGTLVVGLSAGEPDALDPTLARTFSGREVFLTFCQKLYDLNAKAQIVPQLATALPTISKDKLTVTIHVRTGIKFNDGTPFNAAAVVTSLNRDLTLKGSARASEISPISSVDASGALHRRHPPEDALLPADGAARRPRGHGDVTGAAGQARRELRQQPDLRRPVHVPEPRRRRQHHGRQVA